MKKTFAILMALTLVLSSFGFMSVSAATTPWDGVTADINWYLDNIDADTYTISNANEWAGLVEISSACSANTKLYYDENGMVETDPAKQTELRVLIKGDAQFPTTQFMGKTIKLGGDIDLAGKDIKPLGFPGAFYGTVDGCGHTIKNINTSKACGSQMWSNRYVYGVLCHVGNGTTTFKNLHIENAVLDITPDQLVADPASQKRIFAGGLVGYVAGSCVTVTDVTVNGLTVTVTPTATATQRILWGIFSGLFGPQSKDENGEARPLNNFSNITITGYTFTLNNPNGVDYTSSIMSTAKDDSGALITDVTSTKRLFGMNQATTGFTLENNSITYGAYVPTPETQAPTTQAPTTQAPAASDSTVVPPEGDSVVAIAALAAVAVTGILFVSRKRKED